MYFLKKYFFCFYFLFSAGFANEISQGTLKNGMRYYLYPDYLQSEATFQLVIKKPKQLAFLPLPYDLFFPSQGPFNMTSASDDLQTLSFSASAPPSSFTEGLVCLSEKLKDLPFSKSAIDDLCEEYKKNKEDMPDYGQQLISLVYDCSGEDIDSLFSQESETIHNACRALFEPSRMALIITGFFDKTDLQQKLEDLFGEIPKNRTSMTPIHCSSKMPFYIVAKIEPEENEEYGEENENFDDDEEIDDDEEADDESDFFEPTSFYTYFYQIEPSFRNHVLNDLFFCIQHQIMKIGSSSSLGKLQRVTCFHAYEQAQISRLDKSLFKTAKEKLQRFYTESFDTKTLCEKHFLSEISDDLESVNRHFLNELETVTLDELLSFIQKYILNAVELEG